MSLLLFNSNENYLKIYEQGTVNFSSSTVQVVTHNLGYVPFIKFYVEDTDGLIKSPNSYLASLSLDYVIVDSTTIDFYATSTSNTTVHYKIYYDKAIT